MKPQTEELLRRQLVAETAIEAFEELNPTAANGMKSAGLQGYGQSFADRHPHLWKLSEA